MTPYRLLTYLAHDTTARSAILVDGRVIDVAHQTGRAHDAGVIGLLERWPDAHADLERIASDPAAPSIAFSPERLLAPVIGPSAIYCAGANYSDHVAEMARALGLAPEPDPHTLGLNPWHFIKASRTVVGFGSAVTLPAASQKVDWEIELVAVIGRITKDATVAAALDAVAGYTIANDLSCRDIAWRPPVPQTSPFYCDWIAHKSFDGSCPLGPWIVPAAHLGDPQNLRLTLELNGDVKQDGHTSNMIFTIAEQIAHLSHRITLYPGDLVLTGTPAGVGAGQGLFLKAGDELRLTCEGIGTLEHRMVR